MDVCNSWGYSPLAAIRSKTIQIILCHVIIFYPIELILYYVRYNNRDCRGRDCMIVGFTITCAISVYLHTTKNCEFQSRSWRGVLDTTLCDKVCQWLATGRCFSLGPPVSCTNNTDRQDITEILLKMVLYIITLTQ
jgi:hypothetical protein